MHNDGARIRQREAKEARKLNSALKHLKFMNKGRYDHEPPITQVQENNYDNFGHLPKGDEERFMMTNPKNRA